MHFMRVDHIYSRCQKWLLQRDTVNSLPDKIQIMLGVRKSKYRKAAADGKFVWFLLCLLAYLTWEIMTNSVCQDAWFCGNHVLFGWSFLIL